MWTLTHALPRAADSVTRLADGDTVVRTDSIFTALWPAYGTSRVCTLIFI